MWTKKTSLAALLISARVGSGVDAQQIRSPKSSKTPSIKSSKAPTSKAGKKVCLEFGFLNDVVAEGSSTPIGADGPTGAGSCLTSPTTAVCCADAALCYLPPTYPFNATNQGCIDYLECLEDPENGPALVGDWWLQRDVNNGEMFFEEDAVCGRITNTELNSRTRFELWNDVHLGMDLGLFKEFSVGYDYRSTRTNGGGSGGYLNMYLRVDENSTAYYDCNLVFSIPNQVGTGTLLVTPETVVSSARTFSSGNNSGCIGGTTIEDYLVANSGAVMGVGNGELYTFALNTGSTNQDNENLYICWGDVSIKHVDEAGSIYANTFEFTTLV